MASVFSVQRLRRECAAILPVDPSLREKAQARLDQLAKPQGSLGRLEEMACRLYAIQGGGPLRARPALMVTIAGDHGVVREGVAAAPAETTARMMEVFLRGGGGINVLCAAAGVDFRLVNAGVAGPPLPAGPCLREARIAPGTANIAREPAMKEEECLQALALGFALAREARDEGYAALGTGEMGIGNTTASSALLCAFLGFSPEEMAGRGAGLAPAGLAHKAAVISRALSTHAAVVRGKDPLSVLAALGGYEIAALAGLILGGAACRLAVMLDGFIATAAFVAAQALAPAALDYCFFSHVSAESGHAGVLRRLGQKPLLDLGLRLGEGTGSALGLFLLEAAARIFNDMATLESGGIVLPEAEGGSGLQKNR
ncbi:MAG: nicotinate-nucleotide--dimethylbenzimidazole phosphoribosyltransferase [Desulfovibrio sp.]|jgi:nicotinate-nucleotide--dimethylbenzimidazole phosphoribosyltransferase|nr:nicotinate-nucleotide--dimethylbenzimidazole phosphoribosyltransferase [Desulfovibrio sp.]